jgi:hypothetical protein
MLFSRGSRDNAATLGRLTRRVVGAKFDLRLAAVNTAIDVRVELGIDATAPDAR